GVTLLMPAFLHGSRNLGVKIISIYEDNPKLNLPTISATVMVLDPETGFPLALMDGSSLTAIRTGAGGGAAADALARKDARNVALFGAGVQARTQLQAVLAIRDIEQVSIIDYLDEAAQRLADDVATWPKAPKVILGQTPGEAVQDADIVLTATTSPTPLFDGNDLKPGAHVTGIGSFTPDKREIDENTVRRALVVVDSREACLSEAGDIIIPKVAIDAEIGEILNGDKPGRQNDEQITFFKSVGIAVQDTLAAAVVYSEAVEKGLGTEFDLS
ncbi:MAG: ornithine cyclodeaminase family protein, partial [Deltaproteobacteria bacterium]|nr:ornithine cyclodeaminase family protein [Deltaproteobacteria bacterium]